MWLHVASVVQKCLIWSGSDIMSQHQVQTQFGWDVLTWSVFVSCSLCVYVWVSWRKTSLCCLCVCESARVCDVFRTAGRCGRRLCNGAARTAEADYHRGPAVARWRVLPQQVRWEGCLSTPADDAMFQTKDCKSSERLGLILKCYIQTHLHMKDFMVM